MSEARKKITVVRALGGQENPSFDACRIALRRLTSSRDVMAADDAVIMGTAADLIKRRRAVFEQLRVAGWSRITGAGYPFAINCPPVGVISQPNSLKPCYLTPVCPFCWCRQYVLRPFGRLDRWLFDEHGERKIEVELTEVRREFSYPIENGNIAAILRAAQTFRRALMEALPFYYAAFSLSSVSPSRGDWVVTCRGLFAVPCGMTVPPDIERAKVRRGGSMSQQVMRQTLPGGRSSLAATLGRLCEYPAEFMGARSALTLQVLQATPPHYRASEFYRQLREKRIKTSP